MEVEKFKAIMESAKKSYKPKPVTNKPIYMSYYKPTPVKWRKIGDAILVGTTSLSAMMMGAPLSESAKTITIFILNVVGVVGKIITNFAKNDDAPTPDDSEESKP